MMTSQQPHGPSARVVGFVVSCKRCGSGFISEDGDRTSKAFADYRAKHRRCRFTTFKAPPEAEAMMLDLLRSYEPEHGQ